jgi:hypothetical protein
MQKQGGYMQEQTSVEPEETDAPASDWLKGRCCPPFDPETWDRQEVTWNEKPFVKERVISLFHTPLNMRKKMKKGMRLIEASNAETASCLTFCDELSPWIADLYIEAHHPVDGANMAFLSGTYLAKVYEGSSRNVPEWSEDMRQYAKGEGLSPKRIYVSHTACPRCAKAYGKNYVVLFAEVERTDRPE